MIAFRRTSIAKDDTMAVDKWDANDPKLFYTFEKKYTQENRYDKFSAQKGILPQIQITWVLLARKKIVYSKSGIKTAYETYWTSWRILKPERRKHCYC